MSCIAPRTVFPSHTFYFLGPVGFYLITDRLFIPYEESNLERLFGVEFVNFKRDVKKWV